VSENTIEMTSSQGAKWKTSGPCPEDFLPWVAHVGLTITWLALYVHRMPGMASHELGIGVLAGAVVWPAIGAVKLFKGGLGWWIVAVSLWAGLFMVFSLYLPNLLQQVR
jgi:hypothetical protein